MGNVYLDAYNVARTCISSQFCFDGGSVDNAELGLPRTLKVKIIANPVFWGFSGTVDQNVLVSGYAVFSNGYFDFFDGFQPDHLGHKVCGTTDVGYFANEQRTDIGYRSVYDDELGTSNYNGTTPNDESRGGAEVYLIDRTATKTSDLSSCDSTNPQDVFKKTPDNYGYGNKILGLDSVYRNLTGGWRLSSCNNCYASGITNDLRYVCCSGSGGQEKQNINIDGNFGQYYDPARSRCLSDKYPDEQSCQPDGTVPKEFQGRLLSITRNTGISPFLQVNVSYFNNCASGLRNGQQVLLLDTGNIYSDAYHIFDLSHSSGTTNFKLNGSFGVENVSYTGLVSDKWIALGTIDPESCCGGSAMGVDNTTKSPNKQPVYHIDIPKIFNNAKNKIYSNRGKYDNGNPRKDRRFLASTGVVATSSGIYYNGVFYGSGIVGETYAIPINLSDKELAYFGPYYEVDNEDLGLRHLNNGNTITHKNFTCYTKSQTLQIFPDCLTQSYRYKDCDQTEKFYQTNVPRLAFVYRPCNYNDPCSFNSSGTPYMAGASGMPSSLEDLKRGFGGQEVVMYLNLGDAWGKEISRQPCSCDGEPQGTLPPEVIVVKSPVTYPCFPKFDLRPEEYGCQDDIWISYAKDNLHILETGQCDTVAAFDACWQKQPYTTYGFIRNLCGHESHTRKEVIQSLATKLHTGSFTDINPTGGLISDEPLYKNFVVPSDQTGSGFPVGDCTGDVSASGYNYGGITYGQGACVSGNKPYWGLTDTNGRLAYPYFFTKINSGVIPCSNPQQYSKYVDFNYEMWFSGGFPTDAVPFLIEIDHEDYCVGCETSQIELKDYSITLESLPTRFFHGDGTVTGSESYDNFSYKYGFNHCKYPGTVLEPIYDQNNDRWILTSCSGLVDQPLYDLAKIYTGETCDCLGSGGITTSLFLHKLEGTNVPKYWSTSGVNSSYLEYGNCGYSFTVPKSVFDLSGPPITYNFDVYFSARMMCGDDTVAGYSRYNGAVFTQFAGEGLGRFYDCGGCSHSFPATDSKPNIYVDWMYVNTAYTSIFEKFTDAQIKNPSVYSFIKSGAERGTMTCGSITPTTTGSCGCASDTSQRAWANKFGSSCLAFSGERIIKWETNIPGCHGSRVVLYGWSNWKTTSSRFISNCAGWHPHDGYNQVSITDTCVSSDVCYSGASDKFFGDFMTSTGNFTITGCTYDPAVDLYIGGGGVCGALSSANSCITLSSCCAPESAVDPNTGLPIQSNPWINNEYPIGYLPSGAYNGNHNCYITSLIPMGEFTYYEFSTHGSGAICDDGWYGYVLADHDAICRGTIDINDMFLAWEGFDLPNLGYVSGVKFDDPIAIKAEDASDYLNDRGFPSQNSRSICYYDQSVNRVAEIDSEFIVPSRSSEWGTEVHLAPINCENLAGPTGNKISVGSTCVKPIPFNTFNNNSEFAGFGEIETTGSLKVEVIKPACFPEIMTVHKIECSGGVYALHVSREYYEHDRILYTVDAYVDTTTNLVVATKERLYGRIDGGRDINKYTCGTGSNAYETADICSTGSGMCVFDESMRYYGLLPKVSETDLVTPCFPDTCVTGVNPFRTSICANYEVGGGTIGGGTGGGGSGYFQVLPSFSGASTGCLQFFISNPGSGYYSSLYNSGNDTVTVTGCAIALFDRPVCVGLTLHVLPNLDYSQRFDTGSQLLVANTGLGYQYIVYSGQINLTSCTDGACGFTTGVYPVTFGACNNTTISLPCEPSNSTCDVDDTAYYPNIYNGGNGTGLWTFYNLFYDSGYLGGLCLEDADPDDNVWFEDDKPNDKQPPFPFNIRYDASPRHGRLTYHSKNPNQIPVAEFIPFASTGMRCLHSCIQDHTTCGGDFFCNKEFFPRRSYLAGTHVTKFAPFSLCVQNGQKGWGSWLSGHVTDDFIDTYDESSLGEDAQNGFLDPCDPDSYLQLLNNIGIDDHIIYVSGDLNILLSAKHPYYITEQPNGLDSKTCLQPSSGCVDFLGVHNYRTINGLESQTFETGDDTYTEVKQSGCLIEPFKIMVDTQCCSERLGHPGTEDPMYLSWITNGVPAGACKGWIADPISKSCFVTDCHNRSLMLRDLIGLVDVPYWFVQGANPPGCPAPGYYFFQDPIACTGAPFFFQTARIGCAKAILHEGLYYIIRNNPLSGGGVGVVECTGYCRVDTNIINHCNVYDDSVYAGNGGSSTYLGTSLSPGSGVKSFGASGCSSLNCSNISYCSQFYTSGDLDCNFVGGIAAEFKQTTHYECQYPSVIKITITE